MMKPIQGLSPLLIALSLIIVPVPGFTQSQNTSLINRPTLRLGTRDNAVIELQAVLQLLGYYDGNVDGVYSEKTENAVSEFQEAAGLTQDGIVGASTWERLFPLPPSTTVPASPSVRRPPNPTPNNTPNTPTLPPTLRPGMEGDNVRRLQQELRRLGVYNGQMDGVFGDLTFEAVKAVQERFNLEPDGIVGPSTWRAILNRKS